MADSGKMKKFRTRFPMARIKKIMQSDDEVGKVSVSAPVLISKALEMFLESILEKTCEYTRARNGKLITGGHVKECIQKEPQFDFLSDLVKNVPDYIQPTESAGKRKASRADDEEDTSRAKRPALQRSETEESVTKQRKPRQPKTEKSGGDNSQGPSRRGSLPGLTEPAPQ
eukprot:Colp12_sorted_trinity150504_noHs@7070